MEKPINLEDVERLIEEGFDYAPEALAIYIFFSGKQGAISNPSAIAQAQGGGSQGYTTGTIAVNGIAGFSGSGYSPNGTYTLQVLNPDFSVLANLTEQIVGGNFTASMAGLKPQTTYQVIWQKGTFANQSFTTP